MTTLNREADKVARAKAFAQWVEEYALRAEPNYDPLTEADCMAAFKAGAEWQARAPLPPSSQEAIRNATFDEVAAHLAAQAERGKDAEDANTLKITMRQGSHNVERLVTCLSLDYAVSPAKLIGNYAIEMYSKLSAMSGKRGQE